MRSLCRAALALALLPVSVPVLAQDIEAGKTQQNLLAGKTQQNLLIDGRLTEPSWETAGGITDFKQKDPIEGASASEDTRVRILYDQNQLYFGIEIRDSEPGAIRASELRRDNTLEADDTFAVLIDTFHDHRNAFLFRINARGTRYDGLIRNESRVISNDWDEQWTASAAMTETGWTAEIAIPFKILRFPKNPEQIWGLNFERVIKRKNEFVYWAGWDRNYAFTNVSQAGHLRGLSGIKQEERLRIRPYISAGAEDFNAVTTPRDRVIREAGIDDLKFSVTSNLTADLAVNPDFAQTEVDAQQVNLTQFDIFFPEKRQFFIEGADSLKLGVGLLHFGAPPLELFYSRRIGLNDAREPISIDAGGKLTGKTAGFDLGLLNAHSAGENFSVGRLRKELLGRSYIGAIFTNRQGLDKYNRVAGADARFVFKNHLNVAALAAKSTDKNGPADDRWARQAGIEWRDDKIEIGVNYLKVDPNFNPGIGFVLRKDRMIGARIDWKPRPGGQIIRQFDISPSNIVYHNNVGDIQRRLTRQNFAITFQSGDRIDFDGANWVERVPRPFPVGPGVTLPVGLYQWNEGVVTLRSYNGRKASGILGFSAGGFYNGQKRTVNFLGETRPNKNLSFGPTYSYNNVDLASGSFDTHLIGLRSNLSFTSNLLTSTYMQYNSAGNLANLQVRVNYIFRTIDNFFIVYNETRFVDGVFTRKSNRSLVLKLTYSIHR